MNTLRDYHQDTTPETELNSQLDYYKRNAQKTGIIRLREAEELSCLITARKQAEEELRRVRDRLEQSVAERTAALSVINEVLLEEIHQRKRAAAEVIESEKKYRTIFMDSAEAMCLEQDGTIIDVNPAWLRLYRYEQKEEVIGKNNDLFFEPLSRQHLLSSIVDPHASNNDGQQFQIVTREKTPVIVEIFISTISLSCKPALLLTIRDLTERKKIEEQNRTLKERLHQSEKMEAIAQLAGGVAHELNNILSCLICYPALLLQNLPEGCRERDHVLKIEKAGQKAAVIIQDLLTFTHEQVPFAEQVQINAIVSDCITTLEYEQFHEQYPTVAIITDLEPDLSCVNGSTALLLKALLKLVSNAAETMPGGGTITIRTEGVTIAPELHKITRLEANSYILLQVIDTGKGISKTDCIHLFEPFYIKKVMGRRGNGLDMAVVWRIIKDHKGHIEVKSAPGRKTTFSLYLPACHAA